MSKVNTKCFQFNSSIQNWLSFSVLFLLNLISFTLYAQQVRLEKLGLGINTDRYDEIAPLISPDGNTLYFTRVGDPNFVKTLMVDGEDQSTKGDYMQYLSSIYTRLAKRSIYNPSQSSFNQDVWIASGSGFDFFELDHPGPPLNNALPNSICGVTPDPNKFIVINQFPEEGGMNEGFSTIEHLGDNIWTQPRPLLIENYYTQSDGVSLTMSHDGEVLLLSLNRRDGYGGNDLFVSFKLGVNHYSEPRNLGFQLNTGYEEVTPALSEDKMTLYFASDRAYSNGRDIYFARRLDDTWQSWSSPRRFKEPINSDYDDSQPHFNPASGYLYFVSKREGSNDLYRVRILEPKPEHGIVQKASIEGYIRNSATGELIPGKVFVKRRTATSYQNVYPAKKGSFETIMPGDGDYVFLAEANGFIGHPKSIQLTSEPGILEIELLVDPLEKNGLITTQPIYFERSQAQIRTDSYGAIDNLYLLLKQHEHLTIRVEGHTDTNGGQSELLKLSEERAQAVVDFLIKKGISENRLIAKGYGGQKPISANDTEESRQKNRRVEIRIDNP